MFTFTMELSDIPQDSIVTSLSTDLPTWSSHHLYSELHKMKLAVFKLLKAK